MNFKALAIAGLTLVSFSSQAQFKDVLKKGKEAINNPVQTQGGLTNEEVVNGLKEALTIGARTAGTSASAVDGFYKNPKTFIPWPAEAQSMREKLVKLGMEKKVEEFELSLNRAAEEASKEAFPIFAEAVRNMSVGDGFRILKGEDTAATHYLRQNTSFALYNKFKPIVKSAIEKVNVTAYWTPLANTYNKIPGVTKQNPDLEDYVTKKAINGLMVLIAEQETKIRKDPAEQVTDLLKKVFGKQ